MRFAFGELLHVNQRQHFRHPGTDFAFRQLILLQTKGDVLLNGHVREKRVGLKHHIDGTLIRRHMGQVHAIENNLPGGGLFEACQHAQQRGFTTAGRAQQGKDFAFVDSQADIVHGMLTVERFRQVADFQQRCQRFTGFRLRAEDRVIHSVALRHKTKMVQMHQDGARCRATKRARPGENVARQR